MKAPETKTNNVPTRPGRYFTTYRPGFGSSPGYITVREGEDGLEYQSDEVTWEWKPFSAHWGLDEWGFSDLVEGGA